MIAREFKWGICLIEDSRHTEFHQLRTLLIQHLRTGLVQMTELKCRRQVEAIKAEQAKRKKEVAWGIIMGLGFTGLVVGTFTGKFKPYLGIFKDKS